MAAATRQPFKVCLWRRWACAIIPFVRWNTGS